MAYKTLCIALYYGGMFMNFSGLSKRDMQQRRVMIYLVGMLEASLMLRSTRHPAISFYS